LTREMIPKPKACAKCKAVWYCSKECQIADWKRPQKQVHKEHCASLAVAAASQRNPRKASELAKPENDITKLLMDRCTEVLDKSPPGSKIYGIMKKMLADGKKTQERAVLMLCEKSLGCGKIEAIVVPQEMADTLSARDPNFARPSQMVRIYDPATQLVINFDCQKPEGFVCFQTMAEDILQPEDL